jgi:DNA-binding IclR family transcriptional regulator
LSEIATKTGLGAAGSAVLAALGSFPDGRATRAQVAALSGYSVRRSTLRNALSALRKAGLIESSGSDDLALTKEGRKAAGPSPKPKNSAETIAMWRGIIKESAPLALFDVLVESHPNMIARRTLSIEAGINPDVSTFRNALSRLRTHGILDEQGDDVRLSDALFPSGKLKF